MISCQKSNNKAHLILTGKLGLEYCLILGGTEGGGYRWGGGPLLAAFGTGNLCAMFDEP